jgi:hypothetical protein
LSSESIHPEDKCLVGFGDASAMPTNQQKKLSKGHAAASSSSSSLLFLASELCNPTSKAIVTKVQDQAIG